MFNAIAVLRPGVTAAQAAAEGTGRGRFAADTGLTTMAIFGNDGPIAISAQPMRDALTADVRRPLVIMLAAVGLLLITSTANVASLQLARATTRRREMAIRAALGASRARVARQLLSESLMLGLAGGGAGFILAWLLNRLIPTFLPPDFPRLHDLGVDRAAALLSLALGVLSGVVFGLLPVLRVTRVNLVESLSEDGTAPVGAGIRSRTSRLRILIMAGQVAIACVLLVGASLLGRSFMALLNADRGFDPSGVLTTRLSLPAPGYSPERRHALLTTILDRLAALPGATAVAFTSELPLTPGGSTSAFTLRSPDADGGTVSVQASPRIVSAQCFSALGMRITAGRGFSESDLDASLPVVVVNHTFARRYLGQSPLGAKVPMGVGYQSEGAEATVVGVVDDIRYLNAADSSHPEMYFSHRQMRGRLTTPVATVLVRTSGDPRALGGALRAIVREADPGLVPEAVLTLEDRLVTSLARPRLYAVLLGGFATLALAVAAVGLFGVLSYSVAQRSRELAVRAALGARQADIVRLVLRQGLGAAIAGLCAGLLGSLALTRSISALLYGITAHDALTYLIVPLVVVIAAAAACVAPALRAARVDPLSALRS